MIENILAEKRSSPDSIGTWCHLSRSYGIVSEYVTCRQMRKKFTSTLLVATGFHDLHLLNNHGCVTIPTLYYIHHLYGG